MTQLILHHYAASPFSEKIRRILAFKGLPWGAVEQPMWNPKPELVPLTGGYRRIPVLQIGADVYCDTACIVRRLEAHTPEPTVVPPALAGAVAMLAWWGDRQLFQAAVGVVLGEIGHTLPAEFRADREQMAPGLNFDAVRARTPHSQNQLRQLCAALDRQLAVTPFLLGDRFTLADAACFHAVWFSRMAPSTAATLAPLPALQAWLARVEAFGPGASTAMSTAEALAAATAASPAAASGVPPQDPSGLAAGDRVTIMPDDYAFDPVVGEVVHLDATDIGIHRRDPALGEVVVHFPRAGFVIDRA